MGKNFDRNSLIIWSETTNPLDAGPPTENTKRRYIANAIGDGPAWGVYDQLKSRFLTDKEVARLSVTNVREEIQVGSA